MATPIVNRDSLLAVSLKILASEGVRGVTVRSVSTAAGCSTTGIYTHFGGKQGLLDAMFVDGFHDFRSHLAAGPSVDPLATVRRSLERYREWALAHAPQYMLMFGSRASGYVPSEAAGTVGEPSLDDLVSRVQTAIDSGDLRGDARTVAMHLWSTAHGYVMLELAGPGPHLTDPRQFYSNGIDRLLRAYGVT